MTQDQVAEEMDWSLSKLIRVESGAVGISTNDLRALLQLYGVTDRRRTNEMIELAKAARQRMWWNEYRQYMAAHYATYIGFEAEAVVIRQCHLSYMPALLQTEGYVRALVGVVPVEEDADKLEIFRQIRLRRSREVLERDDPPELQLILDEAVIRRRIGGADVMYDQLGHLVDMAQKQNVTVQIIPFEFGAHPGVNGPYSVFEFADPAVNDVLYIGTPDRDELHEAPAEVESYRRAFVDMQSSALSHNDSIELIRRVQQELR